MSIEPVPAIGQGRCGCASDDCSCKINTSIDVTVSGDGSASDPYLFDIPDAEVYVNVVDTATVDLSKSGTGVPGNPIILSGTSTPAAVQVDTFTTDDTYAVPATASMLSIKVVAGGGGGGGGENTATGGRGGGGGQGGGIGEITVSTADLPASLDVVVGAGGAGGFGGAIGGGAGADGTDGGDSYVADGPDAVIGATGGAGGESGGNGGVGGNNPDMVGTVIAGRGANSVITGSQSPSPNTCIATTGGGAGASHTAGGTPIAASDGGDPLCQGTGGGSAGGPGGVGGTYAGGGGGDAGTAGGDGGPRGGGGGGGGGQVSGVTAGGAGGDGGDGYVEITAW